ncbi:MAG: galactokinase family protein [Oscillospiraceae bacterium]|nr:galactokinase family protein [Oscillospiraceae bacterium]
MNAASLKKSIAQGSLDQSLILLYGQDQLEAQRARYCEAVDSFVEIYGDRDNLRIFSAPGRTEIAGNHTDHNHGRVLAASVNLDVIAIASANDSGVIAIQSKGYRMDRIALDDLDIKEAEINKAASLIRGMTSRFVQKGLKVGGLEAYTTSDVLKGSGLSSSAAFEVLVGTILNGLYNDGTVSPVEIAKYAQYAENVYFGKPRGLMDQMASSVGNLITIDFADTENPVIEPIDFDFAALGCALCIVDTGGNHADLTDEYAAIPAEMKAVAALFGEEVLRPICYEALLDKAPEIREKLGDRALLRAMHFVNENKRVGSIVEALRGKDYPTFLKLLTESGRSSFCYLQNVYANIAPKEQGLSLALCIADNLLNGEGAYRVHGGGFGGTTQNLVPVDMVLRFKSTIEAVFGAGSCHILRIRPVGGVEVK